MRTFVRAVVLALAVGSLTPAVGFCQLDDDDIDEEWIDDAPPPPTKKKVEKARRTWRDSPLVWGAGTVVLAVAIPLGVMKIVGQMRHSVGEQGRPRQAWEGEPPPKK